MSARTTVVDVAQEVKLVDSQSLYHTSHSDDEIVGTSCRYYGVDNLVYVCCLVGVFCALVEQFFDDIREVGRQRVAHLRACVFARNVSANSHQLMKRDVVPVVDVFLLCFHQLQLLLRIVNQGAELTLFGFAQSGAEKVVYLSLNVARSIFEHMLESLILAMNIGKEMFGTLRQIENSLKVYNFSTCIGYCWKRV